MTAYAIRILTALNSSFHSRKRCFYHTHCLLCSTYPLLVILCILLTPHHNMLPSSSSLPPKLFSLDPPTVYIYLAFTALLASIPWLYPPLSLHFYLLMHFSTLYVGMLPVTIIPSILPTWCVYHVCDILQRQLQRTPQQAPDTWKGENNLIVYGQS